MTDIHDRLERLRQAGRLTRKPGRDAATPPEVIDPRGRLSLSTSFADLADLPGMEVIEGATGSFLLRTLRYPLAHSQGRVRLGELLDLPGGVTATAGNDLALAGFDFRRAVFIDTETSGLAGGAGTIVFLTGVGRFEGDAYVVRQYFARSPVEEPAYLPHLAGMLTDTGGLVSFNGKAFDMPLLRSRFVMAGMEPPNTRLPHLDLLHPARRLWRARLGACNFGNLETHVLGHQRSGADVPSWLIPSLWFNYVAGAGNVGDMEGVLYHNLEDVVSMVSLAHVLVGTFAGILDPHPEDMLSLARSQANQGRYVEAEASYQRALACNLATGQRREAMAGLALALRRQGRRREAVAWWENLATETSANDIEPLVELAKYHEWESGDLEAAQQWTATALARAATWASAYRARTNNGGA